MFESLGYQTADCHSEFSWHRPRTLIKVNRNKNKDTGNYKSHPLTTVWQQMTFNSLQARLTVA